MGLRVGCIAFFFFFGYWWAEVGFFNNRGCVRRALGGARFRAEGRALVELVLAGDAGARDRILDLETQMREAHRVMKWVRTAQRQRDAQTLKRKEVNRDRN